MRANLPSFEICLKNMEYNFSTISLSETWLRDYNCNFYNVDCYTFTEVHRSEKAGGGVGIFVREDVLDRVRDDMCGIDGLHECVFIKIDKLISIKKNIIMGVIYRPPGTKMQIFNENMSSLLDALKNENKYCYLIGGLWCLRLRLRLRQVLFNRKRYRYNIRFT